MTVQAQLDLDAQRMEYILCVEGIGWPADETDLSDGFEGDVFVTGDLDGTLASDIGCTIYGGLAPPSSLSDEFDPKSLEFSRGSMGFEILDTGDWWKTNFTPHSTSIKRGVLDTSGAGDVLKFSAASSTLGPIIDNADATWANGEVIWVAGREAILLSGKALVGGAVYSYQGSVRGYAGTQKGRRDRRPTGENEMAWDKGTAIADTNEFWFDRRVRLYMHVPGEAPENCLLLYSGRLRNPEWAEPGIMNLTTSQEILISDHRRAEVPSQQMTVQVGFTSVNGLQDYQPEYIDPQLLGPLPPNPFVYEGDVDSVRRHMRNITTGFDRFEYYGMAFGGYNYRKAPGGTGGVITALENDDADPQAPNDNGYPMLRTLVSLGGNVVKATRKMPDGADEYDYTHFQAEVQNLSIGNENRNLFLDGIPTRWLLDNFTDGKIASRFSLSTGGGTRVTRNIIDVLLMFLTTFPNEFWLGDNTGGTVAAPAFAGNSFVLNEFSGYAAYCLEGNQAYQGRIITSNTTDTLTLGRALATGAGYETSKEYQIRNTIYDVLPIYWGLAVHNTQIDVESFEYVRDTYLADAEVGKFALGEEEDFDLWDALQSNICQPYGILTYIDRTSGKLTARYVGTVLPDGLVEDYTAVSSSDILSLGPLDMLPRAPVSAAKLKVRRATQVQVPIASIAVVGASGSGHRYITGYQNQSGMTLGFGEGATILVRADDLEHAYTADVLETLDFHAMFNSTDDSIWLEAEMINKVKQEATPFPECEIRLDISFLPKVQAGSILIVTDTDKHNPLDPFGGGRGWTAMLARVLSSEVVLDGNEPGIRCRVQLRPAITAGKVAPACTVTSKGVGNDYFVVNLTDYVADPETEEDWTGLLPADRIELRDLNGAFKEACVINSFGSNFATTPAGAADARIYTVGAIGSAIAGGDYVTFAPWTSSNTTNMDDFAAYADADEWLGDDPDNAKEWG